MKEFEEFSNFIRQIEEVGQSIQEAIGRLFPPEISSDLERLKEQWSWPSDFFKEEAMRQQEALQKALDEAFGPSSRSLDSAFCDIGSLLPKTLTPRF